MKNKKGFRKNRLTTYCLTRLMLAITEIFNEGEVIVCLIDLKKHMIMYGGEDSWQSSINLVSRAARQSESSHS